MGYVFVVKPPFTCSFMGYEGCGCIAAAWRKNRVLSDLCEES
jgi:hypothetical protein